MKSEFGFPQLVTEKEHRRVGYTTTLLMDPEIFSIVLLKLQRFTNRYLKEKYPLLSGFRIKTKQKINESGLGEIKLGFYGEFPIKMLYELLKNEILVGFNDQVVYQDLHSQYKLDKGK